MLEALFDSLFEDPSYILNDVEVSRASRGTPYNEVGLIT
jgi:hypothetical protein